MSSAQRYSSLPASDTNRYTTLPPATSCLRARPRESRYLADLRCYLSRGACLLPSCCGSFSPLWLRLQPEVTIPGWAVWQCHGGHGAAAVCEHLRRQSATGRLHVIGARPQGMSESFLVVIAPV